MNGKAVSRLRGGHPWIFASDLLSRGSAEPGDVVRVVDGQGHTMGIAHYSSTSQIALRLLSSRLEPVDDDFLKRRFGDALAFRKRLVHDSNAYRLIHGEADFLPGLVVDRYADYLAVQFLDQGMDRLTPAVTRVLTELLNPRGIIARNDVSTRAKEDLPLNVATLFGEVPERVAIEINGLRLEADLRGGQKTGVYLDQRENYVAVRRFAQGRALDCFTSTGGFALHLSSVCESVEGVDSSGTALETAKTNASQNELGNLSWRQTDVLDYLPSLRSAKRRFDVVVLDPPAFTKSRGAVEGAARGYKELNLRALQLLDRGGVLVSCSCSHHMSERHLLEIIAAAALDCGKRLRVLERRTQSSDHPVLIAVPETSYLKCLIFEVV